MYAWEVDGERSEHTVEEEDNDGRQLSESRTYETDCLSY